MLFLFLFQILECLLLPPALSPGREIYIASSSYGRLPTIGWTHLVQSFHFQVRACYVDRTAAPLPLLEEGEGRRSKFEIWNSSFAELSPKPTLLIGSLGMDEEMMEEMGNIIKASSSDSEMKPRKTPSCVNCLEPEEGRTDCGLVTVALVSGEGGDQKLQEGEKYKGSGWGKEGGISWPSLGRTGGKSPLDSDFKFGDASVDNDEQIFNLDSKEVCFHADGREVGGDESVEQVGEVGDEVRGRERGCLLPLPRLLLCRRHELRGKETRGNNNNIHSQCDFHDVRYRSYQPRPSGICLNCVTSQPRRFGISTVREHQSNKGIGTVEQERRGREPLTVVRGLTHSLLDLPTFLSSASVSLGSVHSIPSQRNSPPPPPPHYACLSDRLKDYQLPSNSKHATNARRSQWTIMCVAFAFFCTCLGLVGTMLSVTSDYQDQAIIQMLHQINKSRHESLEGNG